MSEKELKQPLPVKSGIGKQAVIGISDGLIVAFALATALYVLQYNSVQIVKMAGLVSIIIGMLVGIGGYLSAKFRMESLASKTVEEEQRLMQEETETTIRLFQKLGIDEAMQAQAATEIEKDSEEWKNFLLKNEQSFEIPNRKELPLTGIIIGLSSIFGGLVGVLTYFIWADINTAFKFSLLINLLLLFIVGVVKSKVNKEAVVTGGFRVMALGAAAAAGAYLVAGTFAR
ncbi:MAG: hypothetical protein EOO13_09635 [Chitinophagaceae bacterium]|nr:MAG: hypothetical protein EOO13_09635 [Chitinophagaceae bacterium]